MLPARNTWKQHKCFEIFKILPTITPNIMSRDRLLAAVNLGIKYFTENPNPKSNPECSFDACTCTVYWYPKDLCMIWLHNLHQCAYYYNHYGSAEMHIIIYYYYYHHCMLQETVVWRCAYVLVCVCVQYHTIIID